jgi:prepilin-type processing-associated H-X9-DG protein/prepilin-type N-terminal cleavage/methylation domain-containing protein
MSGAQQKSNRGVARRAFSLVELLVVIGIIGLLIAVLMPVLGKAREAANRVKCLSNLRQIGQGLYNYAAGNDQWLPPTINTVYNYSDPNATPPTMWGAPNGTPNFLTAALSYQIHVLVCPSVSTILPGTLSAQGYEPTSLSDTNYQANAVFLARRLPALKNSSELILLDEAADRANAVFCRPTLSVPGDVFGINYHFTTPTNAGYLSWHKFADGTEHYMNVHSGGGNFLFLDGHGEYRKLTEIRSGNFGLTPDEPLTPTNSDSPDASGNVPWMPYRPAVD